MTIWKTRLFALLILVLVFGVGYSYIVTQKTQLRDQPLHNELASVHTSLGTLQFQIKDNNAQALTASTFTLRLLPELNSTDSEQERIDQVKSLPAQTYVSVALNMLSMDCGTVHFTMVADEHGIYYGEGIPVMSGRWVATATVTYTDQPQNEQKHLAFTFDVQ